MTGVAYWPTLRFDARGATVTHELQGAPTLARLIEEGRAAWAVEVRCPKTLMARVETGNEPSQRVEWRSDDVDETVFLVPGVVVLDAQSPEEAKGWFPRLFGRAGAGDDEPALAREVRERLAAYPGVPLWDEGNAYDPARVATALEPLVASPTEGAGQMNRRLVHRAGSTNAT